MATLTIALSNQSNQSTVWAYITGQAIDNNNRPVFIQSDGKTAYYPDSPSRDGQELAQDVAIPLGAPGSTINTTIPHIAGGRIWFSYGEKLRFLLNPGPGVVEPSVANPNDPNINTQWGFTEFTWNESQIYANISFVDFVPGIPLGLTLTNKSGAVKTVPGLKANGLQTIISGLRSQASSDGQGWDKLIVNNGLRVLSPNVGIGRDASLFATYYDSYVNEVFAKYSSEELTINTQADWGNVKGTVKNNVLTFGSETFGKPSSKDIFSNSTGPFAGGSIEHGALGARLAAAFNRSTLLINSNQPDGEKLETYYKNQITNHYARLVHEALVEGRGYAFPYDDVTPSNGPDQSGFVNDGAPQVLLVTVGGQNA